MASDTQVPKKTSESPDAPHLPLYVGTSGWAYTIWKPDFYTKEVSSKNFLRYYATQLTAVEVNYTFRRQLSEKAAWEGIAVLPLRRSAGGECG